MSSAGRSTQPGLAGHPLRGTGADPRAQREPPQLDHVAEQLIGPFAAELRLPRRDAGCLKRICGVQQRFTVRGPKRFKIGSFLRDPYFDEALLLFELTCKATGEAMADLQRWQQISTANCTRKRPKTAEPETESETEDRRDDSSDAAPSRSSRRGDDAGDRRKPAPGRRAPTAKAHQLTDDKASERQDRRRQAVAQERKRRGRPRRRRRRQGPSRAKKTSRRQEGRRRRSPPGRLHKRTKRRQASGSSRQQGGDDRARAIRRLGVRRRARPEARADLWRDRRGRRQEAQTQAGATRTSGRGRRGLQAAAAAVVTTRRQPPPPPCGRRRVRRLVAMAEPKVTTEALREMKRRGEKIVALTAYDYLMGSILDDAGVDLLLVGDSMGTVVQGHDTTVSGDLRAGALPQRDRQPQRQARLRGRRHAVPVVPGQRRGSAAQRRHPAQGEPGRGGQGRRRAPITSTVRRLSSAGHPGDGTPRPDAAEHPSVWHLQGSRHHRRGVDGDLRGRHRPRGGRRFRAGAREDPGATSRRASPPSCRSRRSASALDRTATARSW